MTKRNKITILIAVVLLMIDIALGVYIVYGTKTHEEIKNNLTSNVLDKSKSTQTEQTNQEYNIIKIDSDEKMLSAAKESLKFIDNFHTEKGYFPCEDEFYINFWNRHYTYEPDLEGPFYNSPLIYYYPDCSSDSDRPQKFLWFYYSLNKANPKAFGTPSPSNGGVGTEYRVTSEQNDPDQQYYKDALKQF